MCVCVCAVYAARARVLIEGGRETKREGRRESEKEGGRKTDKGRERGEGGGGWEGNPGQPALHLMVT